MTLPARTGAGRYGHGRVRAIGRASAALCVYGALAMLLFRGAWAAPGALSIGFYTDPQQFMWFLGWAAFAVRHGHNPLFTTYLNYPYGVNLMWNTSVLLPGAALAPLTARLGPVVAYNALVTLALPLSGWCAYLAIGRMLPSRLAAAAGGLLYGFSPYMIAQALTHPHMIVALAPPLLLLLLYELLACRRWRATLIGVGIGVVCAAQLVTAEEMLATSGLCAALGLVLLCVLHGRVDRAQWTRALRGGAVAAIVFVPLAVVPLYMQFLGPQRMGGELHPGRPYVADLLGFVVPTRLELLSPPAALAVSDHFNANLPEQNSFLGLPLLLLCLVAALRWWRRPLVRWAGLLALLMAVLALGSHLDVAGRATGIPAPWLLFARLPLLGNAISGRLMLYVYLLVGVILAFTLDRLLRMGTRGRVVGAAVVTLALIPLLPRPDFPASAKPVPPFFQSDQAARIPAGSVELVAPYSARQRVYGGATVAMLWQAASGMRFQMPQGYAFVQHGNYADAALRPPRSTTQTVMLDIQLGRGAPPLTAALHRRLVADLRRWSVRDVVVGPMAHQGDMLRLFRWLFARPPEPTGGVYVWWEIGKDLA